MLNTNPINENEINYTSGVNTETTGISYSSFSDKQITKYALKTKLGQYFNFGNFGKPIDGNCFYKENVVHNENSSIIEDEQENGIQQEQDGAFITTDEGVIIQGIF